MAKYDDGRYETMQLSVIGDSGGVSVAGTAAANTELFRIRLTRAMTVSEASVVAMTGGTAASGPILAIQKSLAGTGAGTSLATHNFATSANNASAQLTVTETNFASGDHLLITNLAGTAASTPKAVVCLCWKEKF